MVEIKTKGIRELLKRISIPPEPLRTVCKCGAEWSCFLVVSGQEPPKKIDKCLFCASEPK